jgi:outer membrane protein assembly factor BamB
MQSTYPMKFPFRSTLRLTLVTLISASLSLSTTTIAEETSRWSSFLGASSERNAPSNQLPTQWDTKNQVAWKTPLEGHGQSSPVVWGNKAFTTTVEGKKKEQFLTYALDIESGKILWKKSVTNSFPVTNSYYVSRAAPTPVVDSKRIVAFFESGNTIALSHDGQTLWERDLGKELGPFNAEFGLGASPCQNDKHVFILLEHDGPSFLVALDKETGQIAWKTERTSRRSWSSPGYFSIEGEGQVVVSSAGSVDGYRATDGAKLWTIAGVGGNTGVTPIDQGDGTFLIGASGGRGGENAELAKKSNGLVKVSKSGDAWKADILWTNDKVSTSWASPIVHQGLAYWLNQAGALSCLDAKTGQTVYSQRIKQSCWASPIAVGDRIYFFGKEGLASVVAAGKEFRILSENELLDPDQLPPETTKMDEETSPERRQGVAMFSKPVLYGVAVAGDKFIARIGNQVYCIRP